MTKGVSGGGKGSASGAMPGGAKKPAGGSGNSDSNKVTSGLPSGSKGGSKYRLRRIGPRKMAGPQGPASSASPGRRETAGAGIHQVSGPLSANRSTRKSMKARTLGCV